MALSLPEYLEFLLERQYGAELLKRCKIGFSEVRPVTLRVNTLKSTPEKVKAELSASGISYSAVPWSGDALIIDSAREGELRQLEIYSSGEIYLQSLSSMIPPLILSPSPEDSVLDMAAAPGGKTTQLAAMTGGRAAITACEKNKVRAQRLEFNLMRQGAGRVSVIKSDARRLDERFIFDKILVDAPCSGSGTFGNGKCGFSEELYDRSRVFQKELLRKALRLLRKGGRMVYSTCSILCGENEDILKEVLPGFGARIIPIPEDAFPGAERLPTALDGTLCIMPDKFYEGFFVAHIEK